MTVTELIAALEAVRAEQGDLQVISLTGTGNYGLPVFEVLEPDWELDYEPWRADCERRHYLNIRGND